MRPSVEILEVGPRDGLQSHPRVLDTATKAEFIRRLVAAGLRRVEVTSFVHPGRVPQMADAEALMAAIRDVPGLVRVGLVLNQRGLDRALAAGVDQVNAGIFATDAFNHRNQGKDTQAMLDLLAELARASREAAVPFGVTIGTAFGCPYEGEVSKEQLAEICGRIADLGIGELTLADTIGVAVPVDVERRIEAVAARVGETILRCHFHDTRNTGIANTYAALRQGVRSFDASCGGLGGCPFAPEATGNVATEDLVYMLERSGYSTGVSLKNVLETSRWLEAPLGELVPSRLSRAGGFPG